MLKPFVPDTLPLKNLNWQDLIVLIGKANNALSTYHGLLQSKTVNPNIFLSTVRKHEAVISSKIEGTMASLSEVLKSEAGEKYTGEKVKDIFEVINYDCALINAKVLLNEKPMHLNMLKKIHKILLNGVRGQSKSPGEFRKIQNYIGQYGCSIENAKYIPPAVNDMLIALDNWEKYWHKNDEELLVQLAIIHAQFEIIHPFLDGNGRLGRILIPIFLYEKRYIYEPVFYLSEFFDKNKDEYYHKLSNITKFGDWSGWIKFFLNAIIVQAKSNISKIDSIIDLYNDLKIQFQNITHSQYALTALDAVFQRPIITSNIFRHISNIPSRWTAVNILSKLAENNILHEVIKGSGNRPTLYKFSKLLDIVENSNY